MTNTNKSNSPEIPDSSNDWQDWKTIDSRKQDGYTRRRRQSSDGQRISTVELPAEYIIGNNGGVKTICDTPLTELLGLEKVGCVNGKDLFIIK